MALPFRTRNDIPVEKRAVVAQLLNTQLLDLLDLYSQTKYAHWNVRGPQFIALHELFDRLAALLLEEIDETAERATALGAVAKATARHVAIASRVPEFPADVFDGLSMTSELANRYAIVAESTRAAIDAADQAGDKETADLFTGTSRQLDKSLWFLEAHLLPRM